MRSNFSRRLGTIVSVCVVTLLAVTVIVMANHDSAETGAETLPVKITTSMQSSYAGRTPEKRIVDDGACIGVVFTDGTYDGECSGAPKNLPVIARHELFRPDRTAPD